MNKVNNIKKKLSFPVYIRIFIGMVAGIVIGLISLQLNGNKFVNYWIAPWGQIFIRLLQLIAIPLIFVTLIKGVIGLENVKSLSKYGAKILFYYLIFIAISVVVGLSAGLVFKPGNLIDHSKIEFIKEGHHEFVFEKQQAAEETQAGGPLGFLNDIVPANIVEAASNNSKMLQVIFFALLFGIATLSVPKEKIVTFASLLDCLEGIIFKMVNFIIDFAPIGVTALMAGLIVSFGGELSVFTALGAYILCIAGAVFFIVLIIYPLTIKIFTKIPPLDFIKIMYPVQLFGFTTSSSAATLPVNMETAEKKLKISKEIVSFALPIGTTINMDGTSCYQAIAVLFIAQVLGIDLNMSQILTVLGMTILSSIGTPGIPGGSFVILTVVLASVGIPPEGLALIIGVDRPLDMLRTAVNVTGDVVVAAIVDRKPQDAA
ncbi:MAG: dicarboxylate/amino acid:cation symporter [Tannerella sp.]|nr:dicarboxylate/amino acid:cation symporter [Tannerella sp.]